MQLHDHACFMLLSRWQGCVCELLKLPTAPSSARLAKLLSMRTMIPLGVVCSVMSDILCSGMSQRGLSVVSACVYLRAEGSMNM